MIKEAAKPALKALSRLWKKVVKPARSKKRQWYQELIVRQDNAIRQMQDHYSTLLNNQSAKSLLKARERKYYSQNGEDGLLLYFLSQTGAPTKKFIEFGIEDGTECNSANLVINFGWNGLFIEGSKGMADLAKQFFHKQHQRNPGDVKVAAAFVTAENINKIFSENGFQGELDLLSIDVDGNDYWIWQSITVVNPRVVAIEYNASFGPERSLTVKYDPAFDRFKKHPSGLYHGASLAALTQLGQKKRYQLVGCDSTGTNAFFVRKDVAGNLQEMTPSEAFYPSAHRLRKASLKEQFDRISHLEFEKI